MSGTPVSCASSTPVKWGTVPAPEVAKLALFGLALSQASSALKSPGGAAGPTVIAKSKVVTRAIGVKSRAGS